MRTTSGNIRLDVAAFASLGPGQLRAGRSSDAVDGILPQAVITARETDHVIATVSEARRQGFGLIVTGGATSVDTGNIPRRFDMRLGTTALGEIVERNPEDTTVTAQSGVTLARLQRALAKDGQRLAIDCADPEKTTVGGMLATNNAGGLRHGFGTPRDLALGLTVIDGRGRRLRAGGRVVKNVAGYDLVRLFTGSWGTLGIITEATLRTHPIPAACASFAFQLADDAALDIARAAVFDSQLPLAAVDFAAEPDGSATSWTLAVAAEGTAAEVDHQGHSLCSLIGADPVLVDEEWLSPAHADADATVVVRLVVSPSDVTTAARNILAGMAENGTSVATGGHFGDGIVRAWIADTEHGRTLLETARATAQKMGGHATVEKAPPAIKRTLDIWTAEDWRGSGSADGPTTAPSSAPPAHRLFHELKKRFDPEGVLAPGRFVGRL